MALCSAASNPLTQFTKHLDTDRNWQKDRYIANDHATGRRGFRRQDRRQTDEFARFNTSLADPLLFSHDAKQRQVGLEAQYIPTTQLWDPNNFERCWMSGNNSHQLGINQAPMVEPRRYPIAEDARLSQRPPRDLRSRGLQNDRTPHMPHDGQYHYHSPTSLARPLPSFGGGMPSGFNLEAPSYQAQAPQADLKKAVEDIDWDALFASLDPATQVADADTHSPEVVMHENSVNLDTVINDQTRHSNARLDPTQTADFAPQDDTPVCESSSAFNEGMEIIHDGGSLRLAAMAFEAACQAEPTHFEAWKMLGSVLAEVEREPAAIEAFKEAQKLEPSNLDVMMRLAVSYTNEGSRDLAYQCLEQWLRMKYPQIQISDLDSQATVADPSLLLERIKEPFIEAARFSLAEKNVDPDVQVGLGVLMFSTGLYQMAADCFLAAIESTVPGTINHQSQLHLLWNRYGACLGNIGQKKPEAIQAYEMALAIQPNFVKARCNLGVFYYNSNQPLMGAKNTLQAIRLIGPRQRDERTGEVVGQVDVMEMYETLRNCCNSMCRWDLAESVSPGMDFHKFTTELDMC